MSPSTVTPQLQGHTWHQTGAFSLYPAETAPAPTAQPLHCPPGQGPEPIPSGPKSQRRAGLKKAGMKTQPGRMTRFTRNAEKGGSWSSTRRTAAESNVRQGNSKKRWWGTVRGRSQGAKGTAPWSLTSQFQRLKKKKKKPAHQLDELEEQKAGLHTKAPASTPIGDGHETLSGFTWSYANGPTPGWTW